jgi:hypothetical protein
MGKYVIPVAASKSDLLNHKLKERRVESFSKMRSLNICWRRYEFYDARICTAAITIHEPRMNK